jgi:hypothetical protein
MNLPSYDKYCQDIENKVFVLENEYNNENIDLIIEWLVSILLSKTDSSNYICLEKAIDIPNNFKKSIEEIEHIFINQDSLINNNEPESIFLCKMIGKRLAETISNKFDIWDDMFELISEQYLIYDIWLNNLPVDTIKKNLTVIKMSPEYKHPLELVRTWGHLRDSKYWDGFDENCNHNKTISVDIWEYVELSNDLNNEFELGDKLKFKSDLLMKYDINEWVLWVLQLPLIQIKKAAISEVQSLHKVEEIIAILLSLEKYDNAETEELLSLTIQHTIDLWKRINSNLEHFSNNRWVYSEEDRIYYDEGKKQLEIWKKEELPRRARLLADSLSINKDISGKNMAVFMARHLSVNNDKDFVILKLREAIINSLLNSNISIKEIFDSINKVRITKKTFINSLILFFEYDDLEVETENYIINKCWDFYLNLLNDKFYWDTSLNESKDDTALLWLIAGILSKFESPKIKLDEILSSVYAISEGWNYDIDKYYSSMNKVVHCLIVGGMSAEWIYIDKNDKVLSRDIFDFVWDYAHNWIRSITSYYPKEIETLLIQLWARLYLVYNDEYEKKAIETIRIMDDLYHMLLSSKILFSNVKNTLSDFSFSKEYNVLLRDRFDKLFPLARVQYSNDGNRLEWLLKVKNELRIES